MRVNKFVANASGLSRRAADQAIREGRVAINRQPANLGDNVTGQDIVTLDNSPLVPVARATTIMLNKPTGYVCSRQGQGSQTIYDLLPAEYHRLKTIGRLDKNSSGLLLLSDDGDLANQLAHPRYSKTKVYEITLDKPLSETDRARLGQGVKVDGYVSRLRLSAGGTNRPENRSWHVSMNQGRNRQIRHTFAVLGYEVKTIHRTQFGAYNLADLPPGQFKELSV